MLSMVEEFDHRVNVSVDWLSGSVVQSCHP